MNSYVRALGAYEQISREEEAELARAWRHNRCHESRDRMITANLRLVIALAKQSAGRGVPLDELIAEGNIGLIRAVQHFDPSAGCRLSTYAAHWIRHAITQAFGRTLPRGSMRRHDRKAIAAMAKADGSFFITHGRAPTLDELSAVLGWPLSQLVGTQILQRAHERRELPDTSGVSSAGSSTIRVATQASTTEETDDVKSRVDELLSTLAPAEREALILRFGIGGASVDQSKGARTRGSRQSRRTGADRALVRIALAKLQVRMQASRSSERAE